MSITEGRKISLDEFRNRDTRLTQREEAKQNDEALYSLHSVLLAALSC